MFKSVMRNLALLFTFFTVMLNARAELVSKPVAYEQGGVKLEGYLAYDDHTTALRPGVLVVPEWWGLNDYAKDRARKLAQLGYVAFAVDMYGAGVATTDPKKAGELAGQFYGQTAYGPNALRPLSTNCSKTAWWTKRRCRNRFLLRRRGLPGTRLQRRTARRHRQFSWQPDPGLSRGSGEKPCRFLDLPRRSRPVHEARRHRDVQKIARCRMIDYQFVTYSGAVHAFTNPGADALAAASGLKGIGYNEAASRRSCST